MPKKPKVPKTLSDLPSKLRRQLQSEIRKSERQLAAGNLEAIEFNDEALATVLARNISRLMLRKDVTQQRLAQLAGCVPSTVHTALRNPTFAKAETLIKLCQALATIG